LTREISDYLQKLTGVKEQKPKGSSAGHAAGLPWEAIVHESLRKKYPSKVLRHYEFLNKVLGAIRNDESSTRFSAFGPESLQKLICRGKAPTLKWTPNNPFSEKQNDTAENIICIDGEYRKDQSELLFLDVKTYNISKKGQAPNIISAKKLSEALALGLKEGKIRFNFVYVGVCWDTEGNFMVAKQISTVSLFKIQPSIYINWASAEQLQFHPHLADQTFQGTREEWASEFLKHFSTSLSKRIDAQKKRLSYFQKLVKARSEEMN
jgi:hypothetical protein